MDYNICKRAARKAECRGDFRFPLYLYNSCSREEAARDFSEEEQSLYEAEVLYHKGEFQKTHEELEQLLLRAKDISVIVGALFYDCRCCIMLHRFDGFREGYETICSILSREFPYKRELELILFDLDTYYQGNDYYLNEFQLDAEYSYHESTHNYLFLITAFSGILQQINRSITMDPSVYELIVQRMEHQNSIFSSMTLHNYLAIMYYQSGDMFQSRRHVRKALQLAMREGYLRDVAYVYHYLHRIYDQVLEEEEFAPAREIRLLCAEFFEALQKLMLYVGDYCAMFTLSEQDLEYVLLAIQGLTSKEVADKKNLSISTVSKRYSLLFEMVGVTNKKELAEFGKKSLMNYRLIRGI